MSRLSKALFAFSAMLMLAASCGGGGDKGSPSPGPYVPPANVAVSSVSISVTAKEIVIGETLQLSATVSPSNATDKTVTWSSSSTTVATVSPTGLVTGKAEGTADIKATAGGKSATCKVTVKKPAVAVTSIELDQTDITIKVSETRTLKATVKPDNATDKTVTWGSSKPDIATVDNNGKVTAVKEGVASITATSGGKSASCKVTVAKATVDVTSVILSKTSTTLIAGESETITATVNPSNATDKTVTWSSSNAAVATVNNGTITAIAPGTADIKAECGGKSAICKVTVNKKAVVSVTLSETTLTLTEGDTHSITATINPTDATEQTITWTSTNTNVATVNYGTITAIAPGNADIKAECDGKSSICKVTVKSKVIEVTSITLSETSVTVTEGSTFTITATVNPSNATDKTVVWTSSNTSVATVNNGTITAIAPGTADIKAECGGKFSICKLTVKPSEVSSIVLSETSITIEIWEPKQIIATVTPSNTQYPIIWKSENTAVANVDSRGNIISTDVGTTTITATCGGESASCQVTVTPKLTLYSAGSTTPLNSKILNIGLGINIIIGVTIQPSSAEGLNVVFNLSNHDIIPYWTGVLYNYWTGQMTLHKALASFTQQLGTGIFSASCGGKNVSCTINVIYIPVSSISFINPPDFAEIGENLRFTVKMEPRDASILHTSSETPVVWTSSNPDVATISSTSKYPEDGEAIITAKAPGNTTITASCEGKSISHPMTVYVSGISLDKSSITLLKGKTQTLKATLSPSGTNNKTINWSSSNTGVATVNNGTVTAVGLGKATISASCDNKSASCLVEVTGTEGSIIDRPVDDF